VRCLKMGMWLFRCHWSHNCGQWGNPIGHRWTSVCVDYTRAYDLCCSTSISPTVPLRMHNSVISHFYTFLEFTNFGCEITEFFFRFFLRFDKIEISIRVFHLICKFWFFTSVSIRVFAPFPLKLRQLAHPFFALILQPALP